MSERAVAAGGAGGVGEAGGAAQDFDSQVRLLFECASEVKGAERAAVLAAAAPALAAEVRELLDHHERSDAILDVAAADAISVARRAGGGSGGGADDPALPAAFGNYTLLSVLGVGGMGVVYEAEQASPQRRVALKLIRPELASPAILRRFEQEVDALGMLDHPGIARVYEAGFATLGGGSEGQGGYPQAFIAMELVPGGALTQYATAQALSPEQRIGLMADVCDAVQFAHRRGVIHRDLKPGNILVGADGRPRILDFGVARLTGEGEGGRRGEGGAAPTIHTRAGQIVGTLGYMSPEQASGDPAAVDSRSDIYALGAVLFELLCARPPIDVSRMSLQSALVAIQTLEPRLEPSPRDFRRRHGGATGGGRDLEAILYRALEKDPSRRYQHASELAADLRAYLRHETVTARPPTALYQASKFCRRNRELVAATILVLAMLMVAVVASGTALVREREARRLANSEARAAKQARDEAVANAELAQRNLERYAAMNDFMVNLVGGVRPEIARGRDTELLHVLLEQSEESLETLKSKPGGAAAAGDAHRLLGTVYRSLGDLSKAEKHGLLSIERYIEGLGENDRSTAVAMHNLGSFYRGSMRNYEAAEPLLRRAGEILIEQFGPDDRETRANRAAMALLYLDLGRYADAEPILRELREYAERTSGMEDPTTLRSQHNHAGALMMLGRLDEAYGLMLRCYHGRLASLGAENHDTIASQVSVSSLLRTYGRHAEALQLIEDALERQVRHSGPAHQRPLMTRIHRIHALRDLGRLEEALGEAVKLAAEYAAALGEDHMDSRQAQLLAWELRLLSDNGDWSGALEALQRIRGGIAQEGDRHWLWIATADMIMALAQAREGETAAAEQALLACHAEFERRMSRNSRFTLRAAELLAWLYRLEGRADKAAEWSARAAPPPFPG